MTLLLATAFFISYTDSYANDSAKNDKLTMLNVSYDPTREFYQEYNRIFAKYWHDKSGQNVEIRQSHGGSGKQARAVIDGLQADVVTLALAYDIDIIAEKTNSLPADWQSKLANNSAPYSSTIVFLVRKNNPKMIKDWEDLIRSDVKVITPNPKTSGGARWNYLAAYGFALRKNSGDENKAKEFVKKLFANVPILDAGARGSTTSFIQRNIGDVLLSWENEAFLARDEFGADKFEIIIPSLSIVAETPVAVVEKNAAKNGNLAVAREYLEFLYGKEAQELAAKHYYRPANQEIFARYRDKFLQLNMITIKDLGGWQEVQKKHFNDGGIFDQIMKK